MESKERSRAASSVTTWVKPLPRVSSSCFKLASCDLSCRFRITAMLWICHCRPSWIAARPTPELAPFWMNQSPALPSRWMKSVSMRHAVTGFTPTVATCSGRSPCFSTLSTLSSSICRCVLHVPSPVYFAITQSPFLMSDLMPEPVLRTSKHPSLPGTAEGWGVPRVLVKGGSDG